ncbi:MAG TPA: M13 family metallopeptidase [Vicinamibacterales bacterium]|nr:M13 family metallopeptidase [Vicinamibacterales bacterium]
MRAAVALLLSGLVLAAAERPPLRSGLDLSTFDTTVRPQDDLYRFANGGWLDRAEIPPDRVAYGTFSELADRAEGDVRRIVENLNGRSGVERKLRDFYASMMDEATIERLGTEPIREELDRIAGVDSPERLAAQIGRLSAIGAGGLFPASAGIDAQNPLAVVATVSQGGTLLPERSFYLDAAPQAAAVRDDYLDYLTRLFTLSGWDDAAGSARAVLTLETALARHQVPAAAARTAEDAAPFTLAQLGTAMPGFVWESWARPQGFDRAAAIVLSQPSFFRGFAREAAVQPLAPWKALLVARYLTAVSIYLPNAFADARFEFFGRVLTGQEEPRERWKRAVSLVNGFMGDAVGELYVRDRFPESARHRVHTMVRFMRKAFRQAIDESEWMTDEARRHARAKLENLRVVVGSPARWRDYGRLVIRADDLLGNTRRAQVFENDFRMRRLLQRVPGGYWVMPPQTVNAYYTPSGNEIILPAAVLQPPLFDADAEDAVNYGAIGAVIGHELGHAFDQRGRHYNAWGRVEDWWTARDEAQFERRARVLVEQFNGYSPLPGLFVDGRLTLGENVGDLGGLGVALRAYRLSLRGREPPVIDGFTGEQRLFLRWAQVWRTKMRDDYLRQTLRLNRHAPPEYRAHGAVVNLDAFHDAFGVRPGDRLYRDPRHRVRIW